MMNRSSQKAVNISAITQRDLTALSDHTRTIWLLFSIADWIWLRSRPPKPTFRLSIQVVSLSALRDASSVSANAASADAWLMNASVFASHPTFAGRRSLLKSIVAMAPSLAERTQRRSWKVRTGSKATGKLTSRVCVNGRLADPSRRRCGATLSARDRVPDPLRRDRHLQMRDTVVAQRVDDRVHHHRQRRRRSAFAAASYAQPVGGRKNLADRR